MKYVLVNAGKCRHCNQILVSMHRHDYQVCGCGKAFVDGGFDYHRRTPDLLPVELYLKTGKRNDK